MTREKERFEIIERLKKAIVELESPEVDESFGVCLIVVKSRPAAESGFFSDIFGKYYTEMAPTLNENIEISLIIEYRRS